jgi:predicted transposase YbfD/YdcC
MHGNFAPIKLPYGPIETAKWLNTREDDRMRTSPVTTKGYFPMSFLDHFADLPDPRSHINRAYDLLDIVFLTVAAVLSGAEGWTDIKKFGDKKLDWLRTFRGFDNGIPVDDTIARIIRALDPQKMTECFIGWVNEVRSEAGHQFIAIDGKTFRHSSEAAPNDALHAITVWLREQGLVFSQTKSEGKKNEIKAVQALIETLEIAKATVTLDAMHCQKATAKLLRKRKAHYVLCVKDNQKGLREELQWWFDGFDGHWPAGASTFEQTDAGHGRIEVRRYVQLPITEALTHARDWQDARSIIRVERERHIGKTVTSETVYYISSHEPQAAFIAEAVRSHWEVENKAHWVLDVVFKEDDCRIRRGDGAQNVGLIRRLCMNLARLHPAKDSMRGKLKTAGWDDDFRAELLFGVNP